jgi:hypothetical protein
MQDLQPRHHERGNALLYILIAIALVAALSYAVSQSGRGNIGQLNQERARLLATEIIEYSNTMANAVAQLRLRGVKETELCFDHPSWGGGNYDHAGCVDDINKIFSVSGAGLIWSRPPPEAMDSAATPDNLWHIYGNNEIDRVGTTCGGASCVDLILVVDELNVTTCTEINDLLGIDNPGGAPPTDTDFSTTNYLGTFVYTAKIGDEAGGEEIQGQPSACFEKTAAPAKYAFYKVLLAR